MKNILFIFTILFSLNSFSQTDTYELNFINKSLSCGVVVTISDNTMISATIYEDERISLDSEIDLSFPQLVKVESDYIYILLNFKNTSFKHSTYHIQAEDGINVNLYRNAIFSEKEVCEGMERINSEDWPY